MSVPVNANCSSVNVPQTLYLATFVAGSGNDFKTTLPVTFAANSFIRVSLVIDTVESSFGVAGSARLKNSKWAYYSDQIVAGGSCSFQCLFQMDIGDSIDLEISLGQQTDSPIYTYSISVEQM